MNKKTSDIWDDYAQALRQFVRRQIDSEDTTDDLLQIIFIKVHKQLKSLDDDKKLKGWLYRIAQNTVIDHYRTQKKFFELPQDVIDTKNEATVLDELQRCLIPMIDKLPENYRETVYLSEIKDMPQKEIALLQNISLSGVKSRVQRGRKRLKEMLYNCCEFTLSQQGAIIDYTIKDNSTHCPCANAF